MKLTNRAILGLILLTAIALRVFKFYDIPYTYDEFSALFRTRFDTFTDLIRMGVVTDTLPAGVQVFLFYWTRWFGESEWIVKLPFILSGILSVYLAFSIARSWFNETTALITASFMASLQYTVIYSQIARPYASGLFFCLALAFFLTRMISNPQHRFLFNLVMFVLFAVLAAYNHHFSLLFAATAGISGFFLIRKEFRLRYLAGCAAACLLYLPHLNILIAQLQMKGNEGWLGPLHHDFFLRYAGYVFHYSVPVYSLAALLIITGWVLGEPGKAYFRKAPVLLLWFLIPAAIGFLYSIYINNVLQFSVLIFGFPFLLMVIFGKIRNLKPAVNLVIVCTILAMNMVTLIYVRKHYQVFYRSQYVHILTDYAEAGQRFGKIPAIIDSDRNICKFYAGRHAIPQDTVWLDRIMPEHALRNFLENCSHQSDFLYLGALSSIQPSAIPVILDYYPGILLKNDYAGGNTYIFSARDGTVPVQLEKNDFEKDAVADWSSVRPGNLTDSLFFSGRRSYLMDAGTEYSPVCQFSFEPGLRPGGNDFIDISVMVYAPDTLDEVILAAELKVGDSLVHWGGIRLDRYIDPDHDLQRWIPCHYSIKLSDIRIPDGILSMKTFVWNRSGDRFLLDDFRIRHRKGNPVIYGLVEPIRRD